VSSAWKKVVFIVVGKLEMYKSVPVCQMERIPSQQKQKPAELSLHLSLPFWIGTFRDAAIAKSA